MHFTEVLFLLGRLLFGGFFVQAGWGHFKNSKAMAGYAATKGVPLARFLVIFSGALIFFGGLGVILGVYPIISLWLIVLFLAPTTFIMHAYWKDTDPMQRMSNRINFGKNIGLLGAALMLMSIAMPWAYSLVK